MEWDTQPWGRSAVLTVSPGGHPGFTVVSPSDTGVTFSNRLSSDRSLTNHILLNGSGVALGDFDGDGRCDIFLAGLSGGSTLYRNLGDWKFTNVTAQVFSSPAAGDLPLSGLDATGAVFADLDGDGDLDLLVNAIQHGTRCFRNDGHGIFTDITTAAGLGGTSGATSLTLADVDGDGDLDLYVVNYRSSTVRDEFQQRFEIKVINGLPTVASVNGRPATSPDLVGRFSVDAEGHITEHGEADTLFLNDGKGRFTPVSFTSGRFKDEAGVTLTSTPYDWGLAAMFRDLNGDGTPDLYVCNDLNSPDRIWLNDGYGSFLAIPRTALRKTSWFSMGVDFGDLDRDGHDDFLVTDMLSRDHVRRQAEAVQRRQPVEHFTGTESRPQTPRNTLFLGRGDGTFAEAAWMAGLAASDWSWSPVLLDVDLDGYEDVLITTGFERDVQDADVALEIEQIRHRDNLSDTAALQLRKRFPSLALPNVAFRNRGDLTFEDTSKAWGFDQLGISQGMALADLDNDGDLDVVINNQNAPALLLRNDATAPRLAVRLRGAAATGSRIEVTGGKVPQSQEVIAGGRYLSGDDPLRTFATGDATNKLSIRVRWRSGRETIVTNLQGNHIVEISDSTSLPARPIKADPTPLFEDVSAKLGHSHHDEPFDDFQRQPLLPRSLSGLGPAVCWGDLNGDGFDDLVIGAGKGGRLGVFINDGKGGFTPSAKPMFDRAAVLDQSGILIQNRGTNQSNLLVAFGNYENPQAPSGVRIFDLSAGVMRFGGPTLPASVGPLAMADIDGDGELDLFLGGRVLPGRYPLAVSSGMFRGTNGMFAPDKENSRLIAKLGLVTGAVFTDLDADGDPDLIISSEWGPIHMFNNDHGRFSEQNIRLTWTSPGPHPARLRDLTGWWNGITAVDLDGDGRLDLVACNWGRNTRYQPSPKQEVRLYYGAFDPSGSDPMTLDLLESFIEPGSGRELPYATLPLLGAVLPYLRERFPTQRAFGEASVAQIFGEQAAKLNVLAVNTLDSMIFLNRGDHFEARPLPTIAQLAPAFGVVAADFNGDGNQDLFLSQNFFEVGPETDRHDGGMGLILLGDGMGGLTPLPPSSSGISIHGQQRAAAAADYDQDGRTDLVVTQNGEATRLFHNTQARPGVRVSLSGPEGNPNGVGVALRLSYPDKHMGPVVEIHSGSGYWSGDSPVCILGKPGTPDAVWVRWPGQEPRLVPLSPNLRELRIPWQ